MFHFLQPCARFRRMNQIYRHWVPPVPPGWEPPPEPETFNLQPTPDGEGSGSAQPGGSQILSTPTPPDVPPPQVDPSAITPGPSITP